jgi:para-aminobenzoate synthetase component 1
MYLNKKPYNGQLHLKCCCCLDSNKYSDPYTQYDCLIAIGNDQTLASNAGNAFDKLHYFYEEHKDWMFGLLSYELKTKLKI